LFANNDAEAHRRGRHSAQHSRPGYQALNVLVNVVLQDCQNISRIWDDLPTDNEEMKLKEELIDSRRLNLEPVETGSPKHRGLSFNNLFDFSLILSGSIA
jgi:hypothetical protein